MPRAEREGSAASAPWLQGAQPDSAGQAIERLPGLAFAFEQFALNIPAAAGSLLKLETAPTLDAIRPETAFTALGIVAAVLGVVHAMGSLDSSPEILGGLIGAALVGTFSGILLSYGVVLPIALKIKEVRQKQLRLFSLVKQSLLAFMNGAMPQVAVEFGRKTIPSKERPTIDTVENETIAGPAPAPEAVIKEAA